MWSDDFTLLVGLTPTGRATIATLQMKQQKMVNPTSVGAYWTAPLAGVALERQKEAIPLAVPGQASNLSAQLKPAATLRLGRRQCIEHYGAGEVYLPVLDALGHLGRGLEARGLWRFCTTMRTWLLQMPALAA